MATKPVSVGSLKKGNYVVIDGAACIVSDTQTSRPGKHGHSMVRLTASGMVDDKRRVIVLPGHDNIDAPIVEKRTGQVLSISGDMANIMDSETFETFDLKIPEDIKGTVVGGCNVLYWVILSDKIMKQVQGSN